MKWNEPNKHKQTKQELDHALELTEQVKAQVKNNSCPACSQQKLKLQAYVVGPQGWEITMSCDNCNFRGVVNHEGFEFIRVDSKGKAVERKVASKVRSK